MSSPTGEREVPEQLAALNGWLDESTCERLVSLWGRLGQLQDLIGNASITEVVTPPIDRSGQRVLEKFAQDHENWVFVMMDNGRMLAIDEASPAGHARPAEAVTFPELHSRLTAWWLVHAWRATDFLEDSIRALGAWRIPSAAVAGRALLEETAALAAEARLIATGWGEVKGTTAGGVESAQAARATLNPTLAAAAFGTRLKGFDKAPRATNILTLISGLQRTTQDDRFTKWYDWLSDASHPAFGARISYGSAPLRHKSGAVILRFHSRGALVLAPLNPEHSYVAEDAEHLKNEVADNIGQAVAVSGTVALSVLEQALAVVDDFGLTTEAALLTQRRMWRSWPPARGSRQCPCGRGKWAVCGHRWGAHAPVMEIPVTGQLCRELPHVP